MNDEALDSAARTVIIADDHALVRNALKQVIEKIDNTSVVGEADHGLEAITLAKTLKPTLMILDSAMPLARGMEVFGEVKRWTPQTRTAVVTGFTAKGHLADWVASGIDGLFLKTCPPAEMQKGFALILNSGSYFSDAVMQVLESAADMPALTLRERQILHHVAAGQSNKEIADRLCISAKTVDNHRSRMMSKIGVHTTAQLLAYALKEGLLDQNSQL